LLARAYLNRLILSLGRRNWADKVADHRETTATLHNNAAAGNWPGRLNSVNSQMVSANIVGAPQEVTTEPKEHTRRLRMCMPTARSMTKKAYQCSLYEAQDVLADAGGVDLLHLKPNSRFHLQFAWHKRLTYHDVSDRLVFQNPGLQKITLSREYDVFI